MSWRQKRQHRLKRHIERLFDTITSRRDTEILASFIDFGVEGEVLCRAVVRFPDDSKLAFAEILTSAYGQRPTKLRYSYHYQAADGRLIFRYDNAPHFPHLPTFPHHKHLVEDHAQAAAPPDLADVLREIDALLYPNNAQPPETA